MLNSHADHESDSRLQNQTPVLAQVRLSRSKQRPSTNQIGTTRFNKSKPSIFSEANPLIKTKFGGKMKGPKHSVHDSMPFTAENSSKLKSTALHDHSQSQGSMGEQRALKTQQKFKRENPTPQDSSKNQSNMFS